MGDLLHLKARLSIRTGFTPRSRPVGLDSWCNAPMTAAKPGRRSATSSLTTACREPIYGMTGRRIRGNSKKRVWHLEPSLIGTDTIYAGVEDATLANSIDAGKTWEKGIARAPAAIRRARSGNPGLAGCASIQFSWIHKILSGFLSPFRPPAPSALTMLVRAGGPSTADCDQSTFPIRARRWVTASTTSRCTTRGPTSSSCRSTGT